jgi:nucleoside-diphosphate-sugar epimerase
VKSIKSLLITGSNGFVGQSFLKYLETVSIDFLPEKIFLINRKEVLPISSGIRNRTEVISIKADLSQKWEFNVNASHVLNLAGDGGENAYTDIAAENFLKICRNLATWAASSKPKVIVHASSGACFYRSSKNENFLSKVNLIYSRLEGEKILTRLNNEHSIRVVAARLFTFIGPNLLAKQQYAVSMFIRDSMLNKVVNVTGNPNTTRSYMHELTMSNWLANCITNEKIEGVVTIGSSKPVTIRELAEFISNKTKAKILISSSEMEPNVYLPNNENSLKILGLSEGPNWQDSVMECINICRKGDFYFDS